MPTAKAMMTARSKPVNTVPFMPLAAALVARAFVASPLLVAANTLLVISFIGFDRCFQPDYSTLNLYSMVL